MATDDSTQIKIPISKLAILANTNAMTLFSALAKGKKTLDELTQEVGDEYLTTYHLSELASAGLVSSCYDFARHPENGNSGKPEQIFKLDYVAVKQYLVNLGKLADFYNQSLEKVLTA